MKYDSIHETINQLNINVYNLERELKLKGTDARQIEELLKPHRIRIKELEKELDKRNINEEDQHEFRD